SGGAGRPESPRRLEQTQRGHARVALEVRGHLLQDEWAADDPARAGSPIEDLEKDLALASRTFDVASSDRRPLAVSKLLIRPRPGVCQGRGSVDDLGAGFVDLQARLAVPGRSGEVQLDSTEGVDDPGEPAEVDFEVVVDADPGLPADRLHQQ